MGKKDLKKQYSDLEVSYVDLISMLDTTQTKKLTPFLVKQFYEMIQYKPETHTLKGTRLKKITELLGEPKNELDEVIKISIYDWISPKLDILEGFIKNMDNKRLKDNDINNYRTWTDLAHANNEAELYHGVKDNKNKVEKLYEDEEWFVIKPLSIEASINYGYGTKWCTSMKNDGHFFHKYSKSGVLLYVLNRKNPKIKYAFYSSPKEYSVWTSTDARVDSMETTIPFDLLVKIKGWTDHKTIGPNYDYFDDVHKDQDLKEKIEVVPPRPVRDIANILTEQFRRNRQNMFDVTENPDYGVEALPEQEGEYEPEYSVDTSELELPVPPLEAYENEESTLEIMTFSETYREQEMVGHVHPVHGSITEQGERTWESPYPDGPGGGFGEDEGEEDVLAVSE